MMPVGRRPWAAHPGKGCAYNPVVKYPLQEEFVKHHQAYNEAIRQVGAQEGVPVADPAAAMSGRTEYFIDLVH
jgi:hypothetical protein